MAKLKPKDKIRFTEYVQGVESCTDNLIFLLDNLNEECVFDYSINSLEMLERIYWEKSNGGIPEELSSLDQFAQLIGQYLGQCIIEHTGATWIQSVDENSMFAQPCLDGFGGKEWDRIYPVHVAINLQTLRNTNPSFPGVRGKRVFAALLERATSIYQRAGATR